MGERPRVGDRSAPPDRSDTGARGKATERAELLDHLQAILDPLMTGLGLAFLVLLLVDYGAFDLGASGRRWVGGSLQLIWALFLVDFAVRLVVAPSKGAYLRRNWLSVLSLALPFLRPLRAFRAARALRSIRLVRLLGGINRGMRVVRRVTRGRQFAHVGALTVIVVLAGAVGVLFFDRGVAGAPIQTFGDAIWWSATMATTINNEQYAVSPEARVIAVLVRVYAVSVFGYVTASIASYLVVGGVEENEETADLRADIAALRGELSALRGELAAVRSGTRVAVTDATPRTRAGGRGTGE